MASRRCPSESYRTDWPSIPVGEPPRGQRRGSGSRWLVHVLDRRRRYAIDARAIPVPGRTRWAIYDPGLDRFFVNIANPARIVVVAADNPVHVDTTYDVPAAGPHGLDLDADTGRLLCACDDGQLLALEAATGRYPGRSRSPGPPT